MERLVLSIKESYNELINKVTWPTWSNLQQSTILVLIASLIFALLVFLIDTVSSQVVNFFYGL
ncbi:MAG: preprotein translocase subunit SecE [Saprospiraceae bacterium]|nr:preprotein translocase subunit SecE [Saprospiraceae bacterium]